MIKNALTLLVFAFTLSGFAQTQAEMNKTASASFQEVDAELNKVYQQILKEYKQDPLFIKNLRKTQRLWIQFRDAELDMKYPAYADHHYGSVQPMCRATYLKSLTQERVDKLKIWLQGIEEGDVCAGSVKTN
ncbi:lysozyme inhibitor LprI family protein [Leeuwenhoekiella marinoflava]|uniref:Lysozyme inhibitor LprI-like N-terminal domain-containing protein n=2 Tax=Leeuwenhoekiella marinoflava TaxID=988 RepID=A0A4Q0PN10_9FLAO|nr:lysozyme inhibitor LprI family protein [Leeuwenhoekiella marinoflava]RXG31919.1 putative protein YecT (DUF1311 family) [Leeuwenhoekiella marinoflava]SHE91673.1 Uncharacterized conserved protein YecT, DUF1311 family [Leeuwenhoekiella marinoflava DSM 3653]